MQIAFVHLGKNPPQYLEHTIRESKKWSAGIAHTLIGDSEESVKLARKVGIEYFHYSYSATSFGFVLPELSHDHKFWDGYWRKTFERLFALHDLQIHSPSVPLLHLESDVRIYRTFPFEALQKIDRLAWCGVSESHDVAAVFFSPNLGKLQHLLANFSADAAQNPELTDMTALRGYALKFPSRVRYLPTNPVDLGNDDLFGDGVFDGLNTGYWLSGRDPKNSWGVTRRRLNFMDTPGWPYGEARFVSQQEGDLSAHFDGKTFHIFNLHVHSKSKMFFGNTQASKFQSFLARLNNGKLVDSFSLRASYIFWKTHLSAYLRASLKLSNWSKMLRRLRSK